MHLNFAFVKFSVHFSFFSSFSLPLTLLYWKQSLTVKEVGAFISSEDLSVSSNSILHSCATGSHPLPLLKVCTQRPWKQKGTFRILRAFSLPRGIHKVHFSGVSCFVQDHMVNHCLFRETHAHILTHMHAHTCIHTHTHAHTHACTHTHFLVVTMLDVKQ